MLMMASHNNRFAHCPYTAFTALKVEDEPTTTTETEPFINVVVTGTRRSSSRRQSPAGSGPASQATSTRSSSTSTTGIDAARLSPALSGDRSPGIMSQRQSVTPRVPPPSVDHERGGSAEWGSVSTPTFSEEECARQIRLSLNLESSAQQQQRPPSPPSPTALAHPFLVGRCSYIEVPPEHQLGLPRAPAKVATPHGVFFGQVRFEITIRQMIWLIRRITNQQCDPVYLQPRHAGCFQACFRTAVEAACVRQLDQRLLCDRAGIWFAQDDDEAEVLKAYVSSELMRPVRGLPRRPIIIRQ